VAAQVRERDGPPGIGEAVRQGLVARPVLARVVDDGHRTARIAVGGELEHVQQEQALGGVREAGAFGAVGVGLAQFEVGDETPLGAHGTLG
jgi:hypothetical protein